MDRDTALRKIQKCLSLSKSSEPHEAARALRQAQALMEQFKVDHPELLAVGVTEGEAKSRATKTPPTYEVFLANVVADSFGCSMFFGCGAAAWRVDGTYTFIGMGAAAEVASYTFAVLARKLMAARAEYTKAKLQRYKKNKVAAADEFCIGWVRAVASQVPDALPDETRDNAVEAYKARNYPELSELAPRRRALADERRATDHRVNGYIEGKKARVATALTSSQPTQLALGV